MMAVYSNNEKRNKAVGYPGPLKVAYYYYRYADPLIKFWEFWPEFTTLSG